MPTASDFVTLRGGLTLPWPAVQLALDLEQRGLSITVDGDDLIVRPKGQLTAEDRDGLRRWKRHVVALLMYRAPEAVQ
jgi:hypothetical protein